MTIASALIALMSSFLSLILIYVNDDLFIQISGHEATKNFESIFLCLVNYDVTNLRNSM